MELLPSFSDIRLEPEDARFDSDSEIIPRQAPLGQRFISGVVDAGLVFIATSVFAFTFLELAEEMPQSRMTPVCLLSSRGNILADLSIHLPHLSPGDSRNAHGAVGTLHV